MIYQNSQTENTQDQISYAIRELGLGKMLRKDGYYDVEVA